MDLQNLSYSQEEWDAIAQELESEFEPTENYTVDMLIEDLTPVVEEQVEEETENVDTLLEDLRESSIKALEKERAITAELDEEIEKHNERKKNNTADESENIFKEEEKAEEVIEPQEDGEAKLPEFTIRFPILKRERFDEDNMKGLLVDDNFNRKDRQKLSGYNKARNGAGSVNVSYKFGKGCEEKMLGRLFPDNGIGLQAFRFDIRNPLAEKYYWDTDVENCHFVIAQKFCEKYKVNCKKLTFYVENREQCLKMVSTSRTKAKTEFLKTLYLGKLDYDAEDDEEAEITPKGRALLEAIGSEIKTLATLLWDEHKDLHDLKTGQGGALSKKPNPKASLMSLLFQTEERNILLAWDEFLTSKGRYLATFIHDGGYVEKLEKETEFPKELLVEGAKYICRKTKYKVKLTQKPITYDWKAKEPEASQYAIMKRDFEKNNCLIGAVFMCHHKDGNKEFMKLSDAKLKFANWVVEHWDEDKLMVVRKKFLDLWIADPERLYYERCDFQPDIAKCPSSIYNLFTGFKADELEADINGYDIVEEFVRPIITHLDYLTSGHSAYILKWLANIIQTPHIKSEVAPLIRDINGLLTPGGGTGKNLFFEWFGHEILGEKYTCVVGDNSVLYGNFNSMFEGKLLVFVEEASGRDNHYNNDVLKSRITSKKMNVNKKNVAQYDVRDYCRYIFTSNNRNPLKDDRRFAMFDTDPCQKGNKEYFVNLANHLARDETKKAFIAYLRGMDTFRSPIEFQTNVPITDAYIETKSLNAPLYHKWIINCLRNGTMVDGSTSSLYENFKKWVEDTRERASFIPTQTEFGLLLGNAKEINHEYDITTDIGCKKKNRGCMVMRWNIPGLVIGLKRIHLLEPEFEYLTAEELRMTAHLSIAN